MRQDGMQQDCFFVSNFWLCSALLNSHFQQYRFMYLYTEPQNYLMGVYNLQSTRLTEHRQLMIII